ncbi:MAG TPA: hypothetical protein PL064_13125, partial [Thermogutta sp.]|nr:hypothetical protein [Thermogutta sp.]
PPSEDFVAKDSTVAGLRSPRTATLPILRSLRTMKISGRRGRRPSPYGCLSGRSYIPRKQLLLPVPHVRRRVITRGLAP